MYQTIAPLILASSSPRRQEMLRALGIQFSVKVSGVDETVGATEDPKSLVERLALAKARAVALEEPSSWVLGADTDVSIDGKIFGKPRDSAHAEQMLGELQGRYHVVWGAFTLLHAARNLCHVASYRSEVGIRALDGEEIRAYVASGEPLDKAGAYAVQGIGASLVQDIRGSYTNVVGLPLSAVVQTLLTYGVLKVAA